MSLHSVLASSGSETAFCHYPLWSIPVVAFETAAAPDRAEDVGALASVGG